MNFSFYQTLITNDPQYTCLVFDTTPIECKKHVYYTSCRLSLLELESVLRGLKLNTTITDVQIATDQYKLKRCLDTIRVCPSVRDLSLKFLNVSPLDASHLYDFFNECQNFTSVHISNCEMDIRSMHKIVDILCMSTTLRKLELSGTPCLNGVQAAANIIFTNTTLRELEIKSSYADNSEDMQLLSTTLACNRTLTAFTISSEHPINEKEALALAQVITQNHTLRSLTIMSRNILNVKSFTILYNALRENTHLLRMCVDFNLYWYYSHEALLDLNIFNEQCNLITDRNRHIRWQNIHSLLSHFMMSFGIFPISGNYMSEYVLLWIFHAMYPEFENRFPRKQLELISSLMKSVRRIICARRE